MPRLAALLLCLAPLPAAAQTIVTSARPDRVAVTVYRDPNRPAAQVPNIQWLNGVALISETRQISIVPGTTDIRFEGVAGGIIPQSAIVTGLPEGFIERNRDAYLLSPATLLDRSLGRRVHLRRTSRATGQVREQEAIIRSGAVPLSVQPSSAPSTSKTLGPGPVRQCDMPGAMNSRTDAFEAPPALLLTAV